ncbi:MAG: flagellar biosynthesis repressor FlbT [Alphaproteobacteria bacterium]
MPLRIKLPSHDRIIINGAVLENAGDSTVLIVHNRVDILRRKEVMAEHEATTPARRVYYSLQCAYMFDDERSRYITHALEFLKQYRDAAPSSAAVIAKIAEEIEEQRFYGALKATNDLIDHESERLQAATGSAQGIAAPLTSGEGPMPIPERGGKEPVVEVKKSRKIKAK